MKVLLITAYFKEEKRAIPTSYKLASMLCEHGVDVVVFTSRAISPRTHQPHKRLKIYETQDVFIKDPLNINVMPRLFGDLKKVIEKEKPDVCIISKYIFFPILALPYLKSLGQKVIVVTDTYPGIVWFARSRLVNAMAFAHYHTIGRFMLRRSDLLVLTHEELTEPTMRLGVERFKVIHSGVDARKIAKAKPARGLKKKGEVLITFVGRLASIKGIDVLIDAASIVRRKHKNAKFLLVGDGTLESVPEGVVLAGYRKDVANVLRASDIFVMPSFSEGLPSAVMEAMACSLPVVASDIPGGMRALVQDQRTGLVFPKGDAQMLASTISKLIKSSSLRKKLGRAGRDVAFSKFDNAKIWKEWNNVLRGLK